MHSLALFVICAAAVLATSSSSSSSNVVEDAFSDARKIFKELRDKLRASLPRESNADIFLDDPSADAITQIISKMDGQPTSLHEDFFDKRAKTNLQFHTSNGSDALHALTDSGDNYLVSLAKGYDFSHFGCPFFAAGPFEAYVSPIMDILTELAALMKPKPARSLQNFVENKKTALHLWREKLLHSMADNDKCIFEHLNTQNHLIGAMLASLSTAYESRKSNRDFLSTLTDGLLELCNSVGIEVATKEQLAVYYEIQHAVRKTQTSSKPASIKASRQNGLEMPAKSTKQVEKSSQVRASLNRQEKRTDLPKAKPRAHQKSRPKSAEFKLVADPKPPKNKKDAKNH